MKEEWKSLEFKGLPNYSVSNLGRVWNHKSGKIWLGSKDRGGYMKLGNYCIHRLVAEAFIPNPENKPCVDHINTDRSDNRAENLRWVSHKENNENPLTRKHYSESLQGIVFSAEHNRKISEAHKGKTFSEETKRKLSEAHKGIPRSEETKQKISEARKEYWKRKKRGF